jgi:hypothetical protein
VYVAASLRAGRKPNEANTLRFKVGLGLCLDYQLILCIRATDGHMHIDALMIIDRMFMSENGRTAYAWRGLLRRTGMACLF